MQTVTATWTRRTNEEMHPLDVRRNIGGKLRDNRVTWVGDSSRIDAILKDTDNILLMWMCANTDFRSFWLRNILAFLTHEPLLANNIVTLAPELHMFVRHTSQARGGLVCELVPGISGMSLGSHPDNDKTNMEGNEWSGIQLLEFMRLLKGALSYIACVRRQA